MSSLSRRLLWLLVEWVDERNVFPSYGVVNVVSVIGNDTDLHPGKIVVIQGKQRSVARRGQILRISDEKSHVKEHRLLLERQDHQVKNVLSLCMRTIKEMKSDPIYLGSMGTNQPVSMAGASSSNITQIVANLSSSSDSDEEYAEESENPRNFKTQNSEKQRKQVKSLMENGFQSPNQSHQSVRKSSLRRSDVTVTPMLPASTRTKEVSKQMNTQGTQTDDDVNSNPPQEKLQQMEVVLTQLYTNFLSLVQKLHIFPVNTAETEDNHGATDYNREPRMGAEEGNIPEQFRGDANNEQEETGRQPNVRALQVRRVSAHTTNDVTEPTLHPGSDHMNMVTIGSGNAAVPVRLLNEINWESYTTATRQLLQAIFPRKILATHSLTGKKSPAFANKAPKKCLDPKLVNDIVETVSQRCGVPKNIVRSTITTKCTDEAKLFRNRQNGKNSHQRVNQENVPPSPVSSYESSSPTREVKPF